MTYLVHRAGHVLLLAMYPIFFGFTYWYLSKVPAMLNLMDTISAVVISIIYMYDSSLRRGNLATSTKQVFMSLGATTLIASAFSLFLGASWVNAVNVLAMMLIIYLCLRRR